MITSEKTLEYFFVKKDKFTVEGMLKQRFLFKVQWD